jgi:hypothetical protein
MNKTDFPIILKAGHLAQIMDISKTKAYEIMRQKDFPTLKLSDEKGSAKRVFRDEFFKWLESKQQA